MYNIQSTAIMIIILREAMLYLSENVYLYIDCALLKLHYLKCVNAYLYNIIDKGLYKRK